MKKKKLMMMAAIIAIIVCGVSVITACTSDDDNAGTKESGHAKKALLIILDGWGVGDKSKGDVIAQTATPYMDYLKANYPHSELQASGGYVGLPDGQMGNSETGHLNIGAGRIIYQDLVKINRACADNTIMENPEVKLAYSYAKANGKSLHLMGLTSTGGVHASFDHLLKLIDIAKMYGIGNCYVHCFMDGRDTDPRAGKGFIADLQQYMDKAGVGAIASVIGRFYAMDRDKHWDRIKLAYDLLVHGKGREVTDMVAGVQSCYDSHTEEHKNTDEFMEPLVNSTVDGRIKEGDVVIFFNYRSDRAKELTIVLTQQDMGEQGMTTIPNLQYYCMTPYDDTFTGVHILFPKENVVNTLGEYIANRGLRQLHVAETEKYAHVTSFINGGREEPFEGEDRILVNSPKVATYDLKPEMSAFEVKDRLVEALKTDKYDWIVVNFANADMVGHTGVYMAIESAVKVIDQCLNDVVETAKTMGYETIITADHGNADHVLNADGTPNTTHSVNPVPFIYVSANKNAKVESGALADVAPSILHIMGLQQPKEMTGKCLIVE
jgi:2,3-bisphosphoglycerate-independent phosphoglycerate mutase